MKNVTCMNNEKLVQRDDGNRLIKDNDILYWRH